MDLSRRPAAVAASVVVAAVAGLCLTNTDAYFRDRPAACRGRSVAHMPLTEGVLLRMRGTTRDHLMALMGGGEQGPDCRALRFASDMRKGDAIAKFTFGADGRVTLIQALSLQPDNRHTAEFVWVSNGPQCSDFGSRRPRCNAAS